MNIFLPLFQQLIYFFKAINADYIGNYFVSGTDDISIGERKDIREELYK